MAVNLHAPFYLSQLVLPDMIARGSGAIVNLTSGSAVGPGRGPYPEPPAVLGGTLYGAEKAALERFTQGLAHEVYQYGISVSAVAPSGVVPTAGTEHHGLAKAQDPRYESPESMAQAVLLLATEPLDKVTGRVCYSQKLLMEYGMLESGKGFGFERGSSGYSMR
jgi:NAD(P)-dependent dehydrogenase (short-subunit alcohol dehydrogenase family)